MRQRSEVERAFGRRVRELRTAKGMTQASLANELRRQGIPLDPSQVAKMESGSRPTNMAEFVALQMALQAPASFLIGEEGATQKERDAMRREWETARLDRREAEIKKQQAHLYLELDQIARSRANIDGDGVVCE